MPFCLDLGKTELNEARDKALRTADVSLSLTALSSILNAIVKTDDADISNQALQVLLPVIFAISLLSDLLVGTRNWYKLHSVRTKVHKNVDPIRSATSLWPTFVGVIGGIIIGGFGFGLPATPDSKLTRVILTIIAPIFSNTWIKFDGDKIEKEIDFLEAEAKKAAPAAPPAP